MKKKSFLSVVILISLFFSSLFFGELAFAVCMSAIAVFTLRELLLIRGKFPIELELLSYIMVILFTMYNFTFDLGYYLLDYRLFSALILINLVPLVFINNKNKYNLTDALFLMGSTMFIGFTFNLILIFRNYNYNYVMYVFLIAFFTDLFAYITGHYIVKHKLIPSISPKKTVEGAFGGLLMGTVIPSMFFVSTIQTSLPLYGVVLITMLLSILGQIGDLVFSFIKREYGRKDFAQGGGILDVIDSIIFISLAFVMVLSII